MVVAGLVLCVLRGVMIPRQEMQVCCLYWIVLHVVLQKAVVQDWLSPLLRCLMMVVLVAAPVVLAALGLLFSKKVQFLRLKVD